MKTRTIIQLLLLSLSLTSVTRGEENAKITELLKTANQKVTSNDLVGAQSILAEAIKVDDKDARPYLLRGRLYESNRQFDKALADYHLVVKLDPNEVRLYQHCGELNFRQGNFKESVADFDKILEKYPSQIPYHWQRGISHYYAGMYAEGVKQFEVHRTVNPDDVENAVFHYICLAKAKDKATAVKEFIPIQADSRVPMMEIHALYAGKATVEDVLKTARAGFPSPEELKTRLFYAHLYIGLWYDAEGKVKEAREHIFKAADEYGVEGYMGDVARVHAAVFRKQDAKK